MFELQFIRSFLDTCNGQHAFIRCAHLDIFVRISDPSLVRAVDKTPLFAALIWTVGQDFRSSRICSIQATKPKLLRSSRFFFSFYLIIKKSFESCKNKKPGTFVLGFSLVIQGVDKSNFYRDLEGGLDWEESFNICK